MLGRRASSRSPSIFRQAGIAHQSWAVQSTERASGGHRSPPAQERDRVAVDVRDVGGPGPQLASELAPRARGLDEMPAQCPEFQAGLRSGPKVLTASACWDRSQRRKRSEARLQAALTLLGEPLRERLFELSLSHDLAAEVALVEEEDTHPPVIDRRSASGRGAGEQAQQADLRREDDREAGVDAREARRRVDQRPARRRRTASRARRRCSSGSGRRLPASATPGSCSRGSGRRRRTGRGCRASSRTTAPRSERTGALRLRAFDRQRPAPSRARGS